MGQVCPRPGQALASFCHSKRYLDHHRMVRFIKHHDCNVHTPGNGQMGSNWVPQWVEVRVLDCLTPEIKANRGRGVGSFRGF